MKDKARLAGLLYVLSGIPSVFYLVYLPSVLVAPGDAAATVGRIAAAQPLFRLGIAAELLGATSFLFVVLALRDLLRSVDRKVASLMVTLFAISVPISCVNALNQVAVLRLVVGAASLSAFSRPQLDALAMTFLSLHGFGVVIAQIFWGLWLFPFGLLVFRSGFIPRLLGVVLMVACASYVLASLAMLVLPASLHDVAELIMAPGALGELAIILWLLIKGAAPQPLAAPA